MSNKNIPHPAWDALIMHLKSKQPPPVDLFRAAFLEHERLEEEKLQALFSECMELREEWVMEAEIIKPSVDDALASRLGDVLHDHAQKSPQPLLPRFPFIARIPFLRRFFR